MEADFFRYYNLDLRQLLRSGEWKRVSRLVRYLPEGCATFGEMYGREAPYDRTQFILADVVDVLQAANHQRSQNPNARRPDPYFRPNPDRAVERRRIVDKTRERREYHERRKARARMREQQQSEGG